MNRFICQDFYGEIRQKHFKSWKNNIKDIGYSLNQIIYCCIKQKWYSQSHDWGSNPIHYRTPKNYQDDLRFWGNEAIRDLHHIIHTLTISSEYLYSIKKLRLGGNEQYFIPPKYFYSNGSLPREDDTFGFN